MWRQSRDQVEPMMTALYSFRWAVGLGLAYVLLVLFFFAGHTVGQAERNALEAKRIVGSYTAR